jgi:hypothetical protein
MTALRVTCLLVLLAASWPEPPAESQKVREILDATHRLAAALGDEVWPGFDARRYAFPVTDRASGATSVGFSPDPPGPDRKSFMTVGGGYFQKQSPEENLVLVFHEAFHAFQRDAVRPGARWRTENTLLLFDYAAAPVRNSALFAVEARALRAAILAGDDEVRVKVRQFLAVRRLRQGELEPRLVEFEKGAESNEGLAEYAGTRAVVAGLAAVQQRRVEAPFAVQDGATFLKEKYAKLESVTRLGRNDRLRFYYTGSAQGFLLDRLLPAWKGRVQQEAAAVQDLLAEAVGPGREEAEAALREYGFEAVMRDEESAAAKRKAEGEAQLDALRRRPGRRYTLDISALGRMGDYRGFDPMNVTVLDRDRRLHTRQANFAHEGRYRVEFSQSVLEDRGKRVYFTSVPEGEKQSAELDGAPLDLDRPSRKTIARKLVIAAPHFRLEAAAGEVAVTGDGVVVTVAQKP